MSVFEARAATSVLRSAGGARCAGLQRHGLWKVTQGDFSSQESGFGTDFSSCTGLSGIVTYSNSTVGRFVDTGGTFTSKAS